METLDLKASLHVTAAAGEGRKIVAEIVRYGERGFTSMGATKFQPGSISIHAELSRVKMLEMHDAERSLGYLAEVDDDSERLHGSFAIAETPEGDKALAGVRNKTRDAVSLGVHVTKYSFEDDGTLVVEASELHEVSLVTTPAFSESRVEKIAAARQEKTKMEPEQQAAAAAAAAANLEAQQQAAPVQVEAQQEPALAPVRNAAPVMNAGAASNMSLSVLAAKLAAAGEGGVAAINLVAKQATPNLFMTAALTDVVPADDAGQSAAGVSRPAWFGELWQARRVARPTIDSVDQKPLKSMKGVGYRKVYPTADPRLINKYAGNKTAVPASGKVTTEPAEWTAQRWAGGWDVDRAYFDFNDQEFIETTLHAAYDDYLQQTEADFVTAMAAAGVATTGADVLELLTEVGGNAAALGSAISKIQFAPDLWKEFAGLTSAEAPWWLRNQGSINLGTTEGNAGHLAFNVNPELAAGQMLAYDRRAATHRETPLIRVTAEHIANGGIDLGVFGYTSHTINDARAIFTGSIAAAPEA